ncbi:hypothetical protein Golomagni_00190 [Golovinomyces magnicellulatus]|nr:hypothetical protein Golomagni_00190 [Golovinomyces magnicellulatus]
MSSPRAIIPDAPVAPATPSSPTAYTITPIKRKRASALKYNDVIFDAALSALDSPLHTSVKAVAIEANNSFQPLLSATKKFPVNRSMIGAHIKHFLKDHDPPRSPSDTYQLQFCASMPAFTARKKKPLNYSLDTHKVLPESIWNFDEGAFRVGVDKGETVYVPKGAMAPYTTSPEDRKQVTTIEGINAARRAISPCIILEGEYHMESCSPHIPSIILFCKNHSSHCTDDFDILAKQYGILINRFSSHLTQIMQILDVALFQPYKHWHVMAIQRAMRLGFKGYGVVDFLYDLNEILGNSLKRGSIIRGFREAGLWPCAPAVVLKKDENNDTCARNKLKLAEKELGVATRLHEKAKTNAVVTEATPQKMEAATRHLANTKKALNRRLDESAWLLREHQTGESEDY